MEREFQRKKKKSTRIIAAEHSYTARMLMMLGCLSLDLNEVPSEWTRRNENQEKELISGVRSEITSKN
jgi:hypothetical protein